MSLLLTARWLLLALLLAAAALFWYAGRTEDP
jgi:hypothetical protein